ncbi:F0F1 ATP synthase subunit B [Nitrosomonas mobilis]|uniref:ATP synthase subunit b n=1 Tax=Nitrosomonas mobilis TaxID=51642 RepID=A0A1G5SEN9_9PROT|nr:F0F1 ATP synthase subunit B [Nitrosomonas mobilis]SCZ85665.1 H(+)-transporting ATP synthase, subunit B [Nitrosomonas mobilis]
MLIDWFTVVAQIINFLILVWLLKRFLYKPILTAIDAREQRIAAKLADADAKKMEAQKERDAFQQKNEDFDKQRIERMNQVAEAVSAERAQLLDAARQESSDLRAQLQVTLKNERHNLNEALSHRAREEVFAIARKTLIDLADTTLEDRVTAVFLDRLRELDDGEMADLKLVFKASVDPLLIRTAFTLSTEQCAAIETTINGVLGEEKAVKFETAPDLISGIELVANGRKVAWSIASYLASLEESIDELLKDRDGIQLEVKPKAKTESDSQAKSE